MSVCTSPSPASSSSGVTTTTTVAVASTSTPIPVESENQNNNQKEDESNGRENKENESSLSNTTPTGSQNGEEAEAKTTAATTPTTPNTAARASTSSSTATTIVNDEGSSRMSLGSSSSESGSEDEDIFVGGRAFANLNLNMNLGRVGGGGKNDFSEELIIKRNTEYLLQRCTSLMQRVQGIMQHKAAQHVSRQLQAVIEHPGLNPNLLGGKGAGGSSGQQSQNRGGVGTTGRGSFREHHNSGDIIPPSQRLTKQSISEIQFTGKLMRNIIRHSMETKFGPKDDSATEESDTDDDEVVLPEERMQMDFSNSNNINSTNAPYLPVENNPFFEAITLEKQYEARRASLDFSINEVEYSLTKCLALRKHCKARKPLFQLEKPSASTRGINIPLDSTSSVKYYHDCKPVTVKRMSDMMQARRSSQEQDGKVKSSDAAVISTAENGSESQSGSESEISASTSTSASSSQGKSQSQLEQCANNKDESMEVDITQDSKKAQSEPSQRQEGESMETDSGGGSFIPTIKSLDEHGTAAVLDVAICHSGSTDPAQSSSRCAGIRKPEKNRKVFQLGGIHNIFRDPCRLPSVRCSCFGREELCALCLGRAKKRMEISDVFMNRKEKLHLLDETFHKTLSFTEDIPLEVLLTSGAVGGGSGGVLPHSSTMQQLIKQRARQFPPDFLETGVKPKKPKVYDIKPYVEVPIVSPKKDDAAPSPRKRSAPRKSQSSFDESRDHAEFPSKGWVGGRERKDSIRRTRNQEFDIDNIVIPYSMAATTRVEQLVYKPIETPSWRELDYSEIFSTEVNFDGELEDMSNVAFAHRHNKCEIAEKKRFTQVMEKALNATRKSRRQDSTSTSRMEPNNCDNSAAPSTPGPSQTEPSSSTSDSVSEEKKDKDKDGSEEMDATAVATTKEKECEEKEKPVGEEKKSGTLAGGATTGTTTPVTDNATVITEAMANQALKSLFKVGRRRTLSMSKAQAQTQVVEEEEETPPQYVEPWPQRKFPLPEVEYTDMVESMKNCYSDSPFPASSPFSVSLDESPVGSPLCI